MNSRGVAVGENPVDLTATLALEDDTDYSIQNRCGQRIFFLHKDSAPDRNADQQNAKVLWPEGHDLSVGAITPTTGFNVYAWVASGQGTFSIDRD